MKNNVVGEIISVSDLNVKILLNDDSSVEIRDILYYEDEEKKKHRFEVMEIDLNVALTVPLENVHGLKKGIDVYLAKRRFTNRVF